VQFQSTDANGVEHYAVTSANNGPDQQTLRVLRPTHPAAGVAHNFLYALPVEAGEATTYGDPMSTLGALDAQDKYNLTIVVPSFETQPWYADDAIDTHHHYETYMTSELQPWVKANLATSGTEQHWLLGFSKSGLGGEDLILKHPDLFTLVASWDFPADMSTYTQYGADNYGTDANFQANYRLTQAFVDAHKAPFTTNNRIWIGGYEIFQQDVLDYNALLTGEGIQHTLGPMQAVAHRWDSGWVAGALAGLAQDSANLH
jgi:S-formylglutathione hydrolase FrmB